MLAKLEMVAVSSGSCAVDSTKAAVGASRDSLFVSKDDFTEASDGPRTIAHWQLTMTVHLERLRSEESHRAGVSVGRFMLSLWRKSPFFCKAPCCYSPTVSPSPTLQDAPANASSGARNIASLLCETNTVRPELVARALRGLFAGDARVSPWAGKFSVERV